MGRGLRIGSGWAALALVVSSLAGAAHASAQSLTLRDGERVVVLEPSELHALPQETVVVEDHGVPRSFSGAQLGAVLDRLGAPHGAALRGEALGFTVTAVAADGYRVALSLSEIDPTLGNRHVIVADSEAGKPLDEHDGPLRLVVKGDPRMARSARNLVALELRR